MTDTIVPHGSTSTGLTLNDGDTLSVYGSAIGTTVNSGGVEQVYAGGVADSTSVNSSGSLNVSSGATAISTTVSSGGYEYISNGSAVFTVLSGGADYVYAGGVASGTTVTGGGNETVATSGTAIGTVLDNDGFQSLYGGTASGTIISNGGLEGVYYGGTTSFTTVSAGGTLSVGISGSATYTTVSGGSMVVESGGIAALTTLSNGGAMTVDSGGTAAFATVSGGGTQIVGVGGASYDTVVSYGGSEIVSSGAANFTTVSGGGAFILSAGAMASGTELSGGTETVLAGATTTGTEVLAGGYENLSGGSAVLTTVSSGGNETVYAGGVTTDTTISNGGVETVDASGTAIDGLVSSGGSESVFGIASSTYIAVSGTEDVGLGGYAVSANVASGGLQEIESGGSASVTSVNSGGLEYVYSGGTTISTLISSAGAEFVFYGGTATFAVVSSGGFLVVLPGGMQSDTTLSNGGAIVSTGVVVEDPGSAITVYPSAAVGITVSGGGAELVLPGGTAIDTIVGSSGTLAVYSGGTARFTTVSGQGIEYTYSGGTTVSTTVSAAGAQLVEAGAAVSFTTVSAGGVQFIDAGGSASFTTVSSGGTLGVVPGGTAIDALVEGGELLLVPGAVASGTTVTDGGDLLAYADATIVSTTVSGGGYDVVSGTASFTTVGSGGVEVVYYGGTAISTTLSSAGFEIVSGGGTAISTTVNSGAAEFVYSGGTADDAVLSNGGYLVVLPGGSQTDTTLSGGMIVSTGVVLVQPDGEITVYPSSATGVSAGGGALELVLPDGTASASVVDSGGDVEVYSGGVTVSSMLGISGSEYVLPSGSSISTMISSGGFEALSNGFASFTTVSNGGDLVVQFGGSAMGTTVLDGGVEVLQGSYAVSTTLSVGGAIDDAVLPFVSGATASVTPGDVLSVTDGTYSYTQQLAGDYTEALFQVASDMHGGTLVTLEATPCYCRGTLILTEAGERPIEDLHIGDRLMTQSGVARPIRWIGRRSYAGRFLTGNATVLPVRIDAGALADGVPQRDLFVSPLHAMFIDGALIPASALVNGASIVQVTEIDQVEYIHLELDSHDVILAEGAPSETFIDDDSRGLFHNAGEYRMLYPYAPMEPPRYCAPRLEEGYPLETVRRRIADRVANQGAGDIMDEILGEAVGDLLGHLDLVEEDRIEGWACDSEADGAPVRLRITDHGVALGEVVADCYRADLEQAGMGTGRHGFSFVVPGGLSPFQRHAIQVRRAADGRDVPHSFRVVPAKASMPPAPLAVPTSERCRGSLDIATRERITGWAQDEADPDAPVALQILDNGGVIARVLANRHRADLQQGGVGTGRHAFDIAIPGGLSPLNRHVIRVVRERDGAELHQSPMTIEPAGGFDAALKQAVADAVASVGPGGEQEGALSFIMAQADRLRQQRADADGQRAERLAHAGLQRRAGPDAGVADPGRRALVIDSRVPAMDHDAGSQAILSHMRALQDLGYAVSLVAADEMAAVGGALTTSGVSYCGAPFYGSVEDVLRRQAGCFDVVYLHRADVATRYLALARSYAPKASILYSVADLHHIRLARQAAIEDRPGLLAASRRLQVAECTAAWSADAVITHSLDEALLLRQAVPGASVHHVPWEITPRPSGVAFSARSGVAFIGNYSHAPNVDAAHWLVAEIMPLVWQTDPSITCLLVGHEMPASVRTLARPGVVTVGSVGDLAAEVFDRVRLTVAPLRYGAGVKGKVLDSLAAGTPCVMSTIAAEGMALPPALQALVGQDPAGLARLIGHLHGNAAAHDRAARAGLAMIRRDFSAASVKTLLRAAIDGAQPALTAKAKPKRRAPAMK
jgi:autotransporter passenger strand-loop-strand repeat protein